MIKSTDVAGRYVIHLMITVLLAVLGGCQRPSTPSPVNTAHEERARELARKRECVEAGRQFLADEQARMPAIKILNKTFAYNDKLNTCICAYDSLDPRAVVEIIYDVYSARQLARHFRLIEGGLEEGSAAEFCARYLELFGHKCEWPGMCN